MSADIGLAILHIATGAFFVITGARKTLMAPVRSGVFGLLASHGVPYRARWAVVLGELFGGLGLLFGFLTSVAAFGLVIIMAGAYLLDTLPAVKEKQTWREVEHPTWRTCFCHKAPASWSKLCSNALCTPEAQLLIICATLVFTGAGAYSLDAILFS